MWSDKKSLVLSKFCVIVFMLLLLLCAIFAPSFTRRLLDYMPRGRRVVFLVTLYTGSVPAAALLALLYVLLGRLSTGLVFVRKNVSCLRKISWCCFLGAVIAAVSSFYWIPWLAVMAAAGFMGLIVRVVKNVFSRAVDLQDDAEFTI